MAPTCTPEQRCQPPWVGPRPVGTCTCVSGEPSRHMCVHGAGEGFWEAAHGCSTLCPLRHSVAQQ